MDDLARYNGDRWDALAEAGIVYSRPMLDFTADSAREFLDPYGIMDDMEGRDVLCLASGGGQQSAAFALLGARVTVLDLSTVQLERDREAAEHYGVDVQTCQGDMRDLSRFPDNSFDLVYHAHSLTFVPDSAPVFDEVTRVLRPGGQYRLSWTNPFVHGMIDATWNGTGYGVIASYKDGAELPFDDPAWDVSGPDGTSRKVDGPREFRHALGAVVNGLLQRGHTLLGLWEDDIGDPDAEPGSWSHFRAMFPPWLVLWTRSTNE